MPLLWGRATYLRLCMLAVVVRDFSACPFTFKDPSLAPAYAHPSLMNYVPSQITSLAVRLAAN